MEADSLRRMEDALSSVGLSPVTVPLLSLLGEGQSGNMEEAPAVSMMRKRITFTPLTAGEIEILATVFHTAAQAKTPGSQILNDLLAIAAGESWDHVSSPQATRMRLRRSAKRGEMGILYSFVCQHPDVFDEERREAFRRLAVMEEGMRKRNGWT